jgi:hypothetical protein
MLAAAVALLALPFLPQRVQADPAAQPDQAPKSAPAPQAAEPPQTAQPQTGQAPGAVQASPPPAAARPIIDDETLRKEYDAYRASLAGMRLYRVRYIRVATEDKARDLIARIRSGARFEDLAREHSIHAESAVQGGDLGTHASCRWAKATLEMLDSLRSGQTWPKPVTGTHGWGIYRLESVADIEPRPFPRYRDELLSGTFEPECPWVPPVTVAPGGSGIQRK